MTIRERLKKSNVIMLLVPVAAAGVLLLAGMALLMVLLETVALPQMGLTMCDLHDMGEQAEALFSGLKLFAVVYTAVMAAVLLAAVVATNLYLTKALFAHIQKPLDAMTQGVRRIQSGNLDTPIAYAEQDEFRPVCDAVDELAARLKESLVRQQREEQKKQELIAGMSHDLKSPLTTIRAYTEALLEGVAQTDEARQRYLQTIYTRETDMEALVNRLFELAKLGASEYPVQLQSLPLGAALREILAGSDADGVTVQLVVPDDCCVTADRELLARIVHNLLDNSRKYGADTVQLMTRQTNDTVTLRVTDNGPGVRESRLQSLFEPFYRGDAARTQPAAGSGLGLAVVQRAMRQMGGTVRAENAPGGGLCIILTLPTAGGTLQ